MKVLCLAVSLTVIEADVHVLKVAFILCDMVMCLSGQTQIERNGELAASAWAEHQPCHSTPVIWLPSCTNNADLYRPLAYLEW